MKPDEADRRESRASDVWLEAAWFGVCAGLLEAILFTVIRLVPGWITWNMREVNVSFDFLWIAPLVYLVLFLAAGLLIAAATRAAAFVPRIRALTRLDLGIFLFAWMTGYAVLRVPDRLYKSAVIVLSFGIAARAWTWFRAKPAVRVAWIRRSLPWLLTLVAAAAVLSRGGAWLVEAARLRALAKPPQSVPNVLLIVVDTLRADHVSTYGYARPTTPNLDRIATEGVLFERAIAPSSWTLASHASLLTGRYVHEHHADSANPVLDTQFPTLAEVLTEKGIATAGFSANTFWATRNTGMARGFLHFEDYFRSIPDGIARTVLGKETAARIVRYFGQRDPLGRKRGGDITGAFTTWLDGIGDTPFFVFLNYLDPHAPYASPLPYHTRFMTERQRAMERRFAFRPPLTVADAAPGEASLYGAAYDGAVAYLDSEIDRLFKELDKRGQLNRTFIVITADHGEALSDHGFYDHGHSLYMDQIHVPLIVRLRGSVPAGMRVKSPVSTADLAATILGVQAPTAQGALPGRSLARFWKDSPEIASGEAGPISSPISSPVLSEVGQRGGVPKTWPIRTGWVRSLVAGDWHFIAHESGQVELYHLSDDPAELHNLADIPAEQPIVATLRQKLAQLVETRPTPDPGLPPH